ncbi:MAG: DUF5107 domain-containing protein [Gemmatimonadaceae bacterium]
MSTRLPVAVLLLALVFTAAELPGQSGRATVREYARTFPTYPFGDPNPIPVVGRIYPYFRFDGFAHTSQPRSWKVVELENDYLRVMILPEVGGKIWNAVDKRTNRSFIYFNQAVKFRDVAMRGPWTSGGIEANYGIIGHTPNVATPVDYVTRTNADGSVSCIIGALDLLTRTPWRLEVRLGAQDATFSTTSFWYNASSIEQPYYTWMNVGIPVKGNLQYVYPGTSYLGHAGEHGSWPIAADGRDLSWYNHNDFGGYKSYHVFGQATDFFGAYWHDADFGMVRYAPRDEKAGKKIWIWGLSRQGMIWESLLTDVDGQYSEVQSGRLFNQSAEQSTFTPFKHRGFAPHTVDRWTEYWYPVAGTKGMVAAGLVGALNATLRGNTLALAFSPTRPVADTLRILDGERVIARRYVNRGTLELFVDTVSVGSASPDSLHLVLGDGLLRYDLNRQTGALARPLDSPASFNWQSAYGYYVRGKEWIRQREYDSARVFLDSALARDPLFSPALVDRAMIDYRAALYEQARQRAATVLAIDTYDPGANYYYGLANRRLGRLADAKDGFELAALSPEYRGAAWTELGRLSLAEGQTSAAQSFASKALAADEANLDALGVALVAARRRGDRKAGESLLEQLDRADPLSWQARLERRLLSGDTSAARSIVRDVRSELPEQSVLDLTAWYVDVGEIDVAQQLLESLGAQPEALYWRAQLLDEPDGPAARALRDQANRLSPRLVFPFRPELLPALQQAVQLTNHWKARYYLALELWTLGRVDASRALWEALGDEPDYAPAYAARAAFPGRSEREVRQDLTRAFRMDSTAWRYPKLLAEHLLSHGDTAGAIVVAQRGVSRFPASYLLGLTLAKALLAGSQYPAADAVLSTLQVLPHEGAAEAHAMYRQAKLMLAIEAVQKRQWRKASLLVAAAREWPERLGEGKPYAADVDERVEDWLQADIFARSGEKAKATALWTGLASSTVRRGTSADLLPSAAAGQLQGQARIAGWDEQQLGRDPDGRVLLAWHRQLRAR